MNEVSTTLAQTNMFGVLDQSINRVFQTTPVKDRDGNEVGARMGMKSRKEMAEALNLKGRNNKDALDVAILKESDEAFRKAKAFLAGVNGDSTLAVFEVKTLKNGVKQGMIKWKEISRTKQLSDERLAEGMFPVEMYPAMTLEEKLEAVRELRASQEAQLASNLLKA